MIIIIIPSQLLFSEVWN